LRDYYTTWFTFVPLGGTNGWRTRPSHHSTAISVLMRPLSMMLLGRLFDRLLPCSSSPEWYWGNCGTCWWGSPSWYPCPSGRVTAALNIDLEGATAELDRYHEELHDAHARIAQLEVQLAWQQPSEEAAPYYPSASPPRKRLRYGAPEATTHLG
jgi:hypothetical protein